MLCFAFVIFLELISTIWNWAWNQSPYKVINVVLSHSGIKVTFWIEKMKMHLLIYFQIKNFLWKWASFSLFLFDNHCVRAKLRKCHMRNLNFTWCHPSSTSAFTICRSDRLSLVNFYSFQSFRKAIYKENTTKFTFIKYLERYYYQRSMGSRLQFST